MLIDRHQVRGININVTMYDNTIDELIICVC